MLNIYIDLNKLNKVVIKKLKQYSSGYAEDTFISPYQSNIMDILLRKQDFNRFKRFCNHYMIKYNIEPNYHMN